MSTARANVGESRRNLVDLGLNRRLCFHRALEIRIGLQERGLDRLVRRIRGHLHEGVSARIGVDEIL